MIATIESSAAIAPVNLTFDRFVRQTKERLDAFIRRRVAVREDAEDLAQDVLVSLALNFDTTASVERLTAWVFTAARNRVIDWYRTRKAPTRSLAALDEEVEANLLELLADPSDGPEELLERVLFQEQFARALAELPPEQMEVFVKHELEGMSIKEIAIETGASQSAILSRKFYAVRKLRKQLEEFLD